MKNYQNYLKYLLILPPAVLCCVAVILSHQKKAPATDEIRALTESDRSAWLMLQGWNGELLSSRPVTVPAEITEIYTDYASLQTLQRLPLMQYAGKHGILYTYQLENSDLYAELLTADGMLIGAQCYRPGDGITRNMHGNPVTGMPESYSR
ncbi:MAG: DUF4830 domain-containing protein [Ruminococcus sp.]|nr:DUF4830 domain-containing protein [Ruminococcus sp.]